jgi:DNA-binding NarL/FixJ family response regulator
MGRPYTRIPHEETMTNETIHVLLVEDNPGDIRRIRSLLAETPSVHFAWEHVEQLSVATEILRNEPFDLVLLDLSLPDSQGLDTFSRLYPHAICLPIVILTDFNDESLALQAVQAGAQDYFVKGQADAECLVRALRYAIERKHTETALRVKIRELTAMAQQFESATRIGHELNNSLATVSLAIETLLAGTRLDNLKHTDLQMVQDEVNRMGRLVANLLHFSHRSPPQIPKAAAPEEQTSTPDIIQYLREHKIITIQDDEPYFFQTLEGGSAGYVLKGASVNELVAMIQRVIQEAVLIPRTLGPRLLNDYLEQIKAGGIPSYKQLSPREREVVRLIARGQTNKEIAKRLSISVRTVERHRSVIMSKLGLQNRAELVAYAVQHGTLNEGNTK